MNPILNFNTKCFIDAAEELLRADEIKRALHLLDNLPGYYRDNEPEQITKLRNDIMARIATPNFYKDCDKDFCLPDYAGVRGTLRYIAVRADVKALNDKGLVPHIVEYAPGSFFVPILLNEDGLEFTYQFIDLGVTAAQTVHPMIKHRLQQGGAVIGQPSIFLALEIIEHVWDERELKIEMLRSQGLCDIVHVSTPKFSYDYNCLNWRSRSTLGHLTTYTPNELLNLMHGIFSDYDNFTLWDSQILHVRCMLKSTKLEKYRIDL